MTDTDPTATLTAASHDDLQAIAASQRQELMLAQALDSDLDFAFKLQLQEAISASLTVDEQPSSSTAAAASQIFPPSFDEDVPKYTDLLSDEVLRLEQQLRDHAVSETEFRKCKDDLHRRIHDHRVALEISKMPEDEWEDWGDEFERPFGEGTSKGADDEIFRVYYKGLVEKQSPEGGTVGGLGVAICGPNDDLLFELRKPLSNADLLSGRQSAEYRALIEALSAALELGLERLTFYCDFYLMYKFVSGQWVPKQRKISELVKQVTLLREKFVYCEPYFVPRKDIRFAFKLAREAIISQASKAAETSSSRNSTETCVICTDDADISQIFSIDGCMHRYCFSCMKQHVEVKLLHGMLPTCPHEGCKTKLQLDSCAKFLTPRLIQIMSHRIKEASISVTEKVYCPYPKCSALMSKGEVLEFSKAVFGFAKINGARRCMKCSGNFCIDCKVPWHTRMTCFDYKMRNPYPPIEEAKLKNLAATNLWRQCVKCNHMIELSAGCFHMTCRCGYEFCYTCGAEWKNKRQTCSCPLWDEDYILHRGGDVYENEDEDEDSDEDDFDYFL